MKKIISLMLVVCFIFSFTIPIMANDFTETDLETIKLIENIDVLGQVLYEYGITDDELEAISMHDEQFYVELLELMTESEVLGDLVNEVLEDAENNNIKARDLPNKWEPTLASTEFAQRLLYAKNMAIDSHKTDKNARSIKEDTVYMYIANYIDIASPNGDFKYNHLGDGIDIDPYPYYLTNYCRDSYDLYMSKARGLDIVSTSADLLIDMVSLNNLPQINSEIINLTNTIDRAAIAFTINDTATHIDTFSKYLNTYDNPEDIIKELERDLKNLESDRDRLSYIKNWVFRISAVSGGAAGVTVYLSLKVFGKIKDIYATIFDIANWTSLRMTKNFRITERMYRMLGWDY